MSYVLEACADSVRSAIEAWHGGAGRIELCSNLIIGGTTPGLALLRQVKDYTDLEVRVLLRPRFGDFCYDDFEFESMKEEALRLCAAGADGIVFGILKPDGSLNMEQMQQLAACAGQKKKTLHRAFDVSRDPFEALENAVSLGMDTILTSGQRNSAWEGRKLLAKLQKRSAGRIEILAGAGIGADAIRSLIPETGISSYHMSGKVVRDSRMEFRREGVNMGLEGFSEFEIWQTDEENIRQAVRELELAFPAS